MENQVYPKFKTEVPVAPEMVELVPEHRLHQGCICGFMITPNQS